MESNFEVVSVTLVDGKLEIVKRLPSNTMLSCYPSRPTPDMIIKEIYTAYEDGRICLEDTIEGTHTPEELIPEKLEF